MRCPDCAAEVDLAKPQCGGCGVDLLEAFESRAWAKEKELHPELAAAPPAGGAAGPGSGGSPPAPGGVGPRPPAARRGWGAAALAAGVLAAAWAWVGAPRGPAPPGSLSSPEHAFSFVPPPGWAIEPAGGSAGRWTVALRLADAPAALEVLAGGPLEGSEPSARNAAQERFNGTQVRVEAAREAEAGGRRAWELELSGERALLPSPSKGRVASHLGQPAPAYESMDFRAAVVVVPGARRSYLVCLSSEKSDLERRRPAFERFLKDFRLP